MDWNLLLVKKVFLYIIILQQMIDCNFLASFFLSMYCKDSLLFEKLINKIIIIIIIIVIIIMIIIIITKYHYCYYYCYH